MSTVIITKIFLNLFQINLIANHQIWTQLFSYNLLYVSSENVESIESSTKNLNDVLTPLTQKLYKQEAPEGQTEPDASEDGSSENTVDAEFEEVKEEEK